MKITDRVRIALNVLREKRSYSPYDDRYYIDHYPGPTMSGVSMDEKTSLQVVAVYACVNLLSSTIASLPLPLYRSLPRGKERAFGHPQYSLLHDTPNSEQTSYIWRQTSMAHVLLWGNLYSEIEFNNKGQPIALWPLPPWRVRPRRTRDRQLFWEVNLPSATDDAWNRTGNKVYIPDYAMFHVMALGTNGITGLSPIRQAIEAVGLTMAAQEFGARLFGQGANMGGVMEHPHTLSEQGHKSLEASLNENYTGLGKSHRIMLLEEGMKWVKAGINPNEAQFLETRKFQRNEIASLFSVPPHMIGDLERSSFSNIEQQSIDFVVNTLRPWLVNWEQEIARKLLKYDPGLFAEFLVAGLLRGDITARYAAYAVGRQWGWLSADDVRELENMNPLPGKQGDIYYMPMNMLPAGEVELTETNNLRTVEPPEVRKLQSAKNRFQIASSYKGVFEDAARRIVERERSSILKAAKKHLGERSLDSWNDALREFYREFSSYINKQMSPVVRGLADAIYPVASDEVNSTQDFTIEVDKFVNDYQNAFSTRYTNSSSGQLTKIVNDALQANEDSLPLIETRLDEWGAKRAGKVALNETVQLSNAVAYFVFAGAGITKLRWNAMGSKPCPFCQELDGKVVGIEQPFVSKDDSLEAEGKSDMKINRPTMHAPLHASCTCQITPE